MPDSPMQLVYKEADEVARHLERRPFPVLAGALRASTGDILERWHRRSIEVMPDLDRLSIAEFENSIPEALAAMATALERPGTESVRRFIHASPAHGSARFAQQFGPHVMLAEERILRSAIVLELRAALARPLCAEEAAAFHELFDLMSEYSLLYMMQARGDARDRQILTEFGGMQRLADLGTLAAGLAHDAANLMLPIRTRLDFLRSAELPAQAREDVEGLLLLVDHLQDFISNLRMLSVDPQRRREGAAQTVDLAVWWGRVSKFHRRMLPPHIELMSDLPADLPRVAIAAPVLSQVTFNLIRNAQSAMGEQAKGRITIRSEAGPDLDCLDLIVEDDGPGMPPEILARCFEPFFSGDPASPRGGSGLGLAIVSAMVVGSGGRVRAQSPPPGKPRGAMFILSLPLAQASQR